MSVKKYVNRIFLTAVIVGISACGGGGGDSSSGPTQSSASTSTISSTSSSSIAVGAISGTVTSATDGSGLGGATVSAAGVSTTTGSDGAFTLSGVTVGDRIVVKSEATGYATNFEVVSVTVGSTSSIRLQNLPVGVTTTIGSASGGTVSVPNSTAQLILPANAVATVSGASYSGNVSVSMTPINPAVYVNVMPGEYTAASGSSISDIESFGALNVELRGTSNQLLNLASGQSATIRIPVATRSATSPATIPLFYFNETTGLWVQEGSATLNSAGTFYEGTVSHFSTWNADQIANSVLLNGCIVDGSNLPVSNARVITDGVNYSGTSSAFTNAAGQFSVRLKLNGTATVVGQSGAMITNTISVGPSSTDITRTTCLVMSQSNAAASIKLTWGSSPSDLDSHLITPSGAHVYFSSKGSLTAAPFANLDVDDTSSFGPEVVTITKLMVGTYYYVVHNFSGTFPPGISGSPAHVDLTVNGATVGFAPSTSETSSTKYWNVFTLTVSANCTISMTRTNTWSTSLPSVVTSTPVYCTQ